MAAGFAATLFGDALVRETFFFTELLFAVLFFLADFLFADFFADFFAVAFRG